MYGDYEIRRNENIVSVSGVLKVEAIGEIVDHIRHITLIARYPTIRFDFSKVELFYPSALVTLLARIKFIQKNQIDVFIEQPTSDRAFGQLTSSDWMHHVFPNEYSPSRLKLEKRIPIFAYNDADSQGSAVTNITKALLLQIPQLDRSQLRSAQWALSEITDNVLNHAKSIVGGFVHCQIHQQRKLIEFIVADSGIGIPRTLNESNAGTALEMAIKEGVTANKETNQGNGLYGTWRLATMSDGIFVIHSYRGKLFVRPGGTVKVQSDAPLYGGTYVICQIDYSDPSLISRALTFKQSLHVPAYDYIEQAFETGVDGRSTIKLIDHVSSFGSRESGKKVSNLINNVISMSDDSHIDVDFEGVLIVSSSFADECFGRLISAMGPSEFFSKITFKNADSSIRSIIDRSVIQRMRIAQ